MWFVRKSRHVALQAELMSLQVHCETLKAEIELLLVKVKEVTEAKESAERALEANARPARKRSKRTPKESD